MSLRRIAALVFALAAACARSVNSEATPAFVDFAVFDPSTGAIPLPNDLALLPQSVSALPEGPQKDLLEAFQIMGGFPNDQEVDITIDFVRESVTSIGPTTSAPDLDVTTIGPTTLLVLKVGGLGAAAVDYDVGGYAINGEKGTLALRPKPNPQGKRFWDPAQYIVAVRGGIDGVKTVGGGVVNPEPAMFLLLQGKNLADPANQALLPDPAAGAQLEQIREGYIDAFMLVDAAFPSRELAVLQTFKIAPAKTHVVVDQAAGIVPFPSNFLLDYTKSPPRVVNNPAFGPAAPGLATLDGFTTTGMLTATTSAAIDPSTVNNGTVFLFRVVAGVAQRVFEVADFVGSACSAAKSPTFVAQPPPLNAGPISTIALQPAVPIMTVPGGFCGGKIMLPPLEESSDYIVVITNRVKDANGNALGPDTAASLLLFTSPLILDGVPTVPGLDVPTATLLDILRGQTVQVFPALAAMGFTKADVAFAYPIHTQSITEASLQLAALPFSIEGAAHAAVFSPVTTSVQTLDVTAAFGIPAPPDVDSFYTLLTPTLDAIDQTTGALRPDLATLTPVQLAGLVKPLTAIVAVPKYASVPSCGLPPPLDALHCAKVVVFEHGLGGGHLQTILFADALAKSGFIVAAIDFPLHGDRAPCSVPSEATDCNTGGTCNLIPGGAGQGDVNPPGICSNGNKLDPTTLTSVASGRYFLSANFFRIRDSFRQNLIDQSALALSIARPPASAWPFQPAQNDLAAALQAKGIVADPSAVYVEGISLGSIAGTQVLATSSRFTRGALSVGGATETDVILNSPTFKPQIDALFINSLGFDRNDPANAARYLLTINLAKWILDPGDPLNFAKHVRTSPLPDLLSPTLARQAKKDVWGQIAQGDLVVPNPYNLLLYGDSAVPFTLYTHNGGDAPHSMLAVSAAAQANAAGWLLDLTNPGASVDLTDF